MFYLNMAIYIYSNNNIDKIMFGFQTFGRRMMQVAAKNFSVTNKYSFSQSLTWSNMYFQFISKVNKLIVSSNNSSTKFSIDEYNESPIINLKMQLISLIRTQFKYYAI